MAIVWVLGHAPSIVFTDPTLIFMEWRTVGMHALAMALLAGVFGQVVDFDYVNYDDPEYAEQNDRVRAGLTAANIVWAFQSGEVANWHPLTWLSLMADVELFGDGPRGHHLANLVLHIIGVSLLFEALRHASADRTPSWFAALLWGLHPLHVESVAWISERKGILSTCLGMAALLAYVRWSKSRACAGTLASGGRIWRMATLVFFGLSLLAKQMLVTLPILLLLLDFWPLSRWRRVTWRSLIREKLPFVALALVFSVVAYVAQKRGGAVGDWDRIPISQRSSNAGFSAATYLQKLVYPAELSAIYPHPKDRLSIATVALSGGVIILLSVLAVLTRNRWPWLWTGWFWYCIALTPVLGLVPIGLHGMADRYTDIPMIGIWIALVWTWKAVVPGHGLILGTGILAACSTCSWRQTAYWQDGATLFEHAVLANQENTLAHYNLGEALRRKGDLELARSHFERAVELAPDMTRAWTNLGGILMQQRQYSRAESAFRKATDVQPEVAEYQFNLGTALLANNKTTAAAVALSRSLELDGSLAAARQNLAVALMETGRLPQAVAVLENVDSPEKMDDDYLELLVRLQEKLSEVVFKTGKVVEADALNRRAAATAKLLKSRHQR